MSQRQKSPGATTPQCDAAAQRGNSAAKRGAAHASAVLAKTAEPTREERLARITHHLRTTHTLPTVDGGYGGLECFDSVCHSAESILHMIDHHMIDEERFCWRDKSHGRNQLICICFVPGCGIGPFVPFRQ